MASTKDCPICLGELDTPSKADKCQHTFCYACLKAWSLSSLACPLCKASFTKIIRIGEGIAEDLPKPTKKTVDDTVADLECLTDKELLVENARLLDSATRAEREIFMSASQKDRREFEYKQLKRVISGLEAMRSHLMSHDRYDPRATMEQLYRWDHVLRLLWTGNIEDLVALASAEEASRQPSKVRYGADDEYHEEDGDNYEEDNYDDYDEDEGY